MLFIAFFGIITNHNDINYFKYLALHVQQVVLGNVITALDKVSQDLDKKSFVPKVLSSDGPF